jgi:aspartyl-tRNA(Asn)/glutamyl-tRNA(Gln) amidotransferase subunit C
VAVSLDDVRDIAELAKLELTEEEIATYAKQLSDILNYFEHLQAVDTSGVDAIASVLPLSSVLRPDVALPALDPQDAIANAPEAQDNQFRVHAVLDE